MWIYVSSEDGRTCLILALLMPITYTIYLSKYGHQLIVQSGANCLAAETYSTFISRHPRTCSPGSIPTTSAISGRRRRSRNIGFGAERRAKRDGEPSCSFSRCVVTASASINCHLLLRTAGLNGSARPSSVRCRWNDRPPSYRCK